METKPCVNCGKPITLEIPFSDGGFRGLKSKEHGCGPNFVWARLITVSKSERDEWNKIRDELMQYLPRD